MPGTVSITSQPWTIGDLYLTWIQYYEVPAIQREIQALC